ncbi:hypothetical protein EGR_03225 [Echinococcus granulosus]|uniref:Uncharacterized protein n=1 Tax=Echinococcus granulosus TaxID=6210 RepID=W6UUD7_ECHGR|nr:hypothetical protein EGR_03225 [Echinococcus granulosus]EUB61952.1 hypothetical protein EGR_03225 [Echinococcus granulosus]
MARRESTRRGFRDCQRSESPTNTISSYTPISPQPRAARRNRAPIRFNSPSYTNSPVLPFFSAQTNTSFGDIFTAVLGSKLAKQSTSKNLHSQMEPLLLSEPMKSNNVVKKAPITQTFLEPLAFECRVREDRERQLDIRCLRIIRKLNCYPEYQEIVRRFANVESEMDAEALMTSCVNKARLRSSCGVRAYLRKFLRLKEPTHPLTVSQATLLLSSDSTPEHSCVREVNGSPNRYERNLYSARRLSRNSMILEQSSEMEETWAMERSVNMTNGSSGSGTVVVAAAPRNLPPETLLRRLARSISIRLAYKRCLLEQANQRLTELDKVTNVIRSILRKATDEALPQMRNGTEVCYFNIPPIAPPVAEVVEMKLCQVTSDHPLLRSFPLPSTLSIPALVSNSAETALPEVTANLLPRFDRLLSSQTAVLELLCQLTRRLYCLDRRIAERIATGADTTTRLGDEQQPCELDAILFPLQSRRQQLVEQIAEAQRLRDDFEGTKVRLLSGLQHQFFVLHDTFIHSEGTKSGENSLGSPVGQNLEPSSEQLCVYWAKAEVGLGLESGGVMSLSGRVEMQPHCIHLFALASTRLQGSIPQTDSSCFVEKATSICLTFFQSFLAAYDAKAVGIAGCAPPSINSGTELVQPYGQIKEQRSVPQDPEWCQVREPRPRSGSTIPLSSLVQTRGGVHLEGERTGLTVIHVATWFSSVDSSCQLLFLITRLVGREGMVKEEEEERRRRRASLSEGHECFNSSGRSSPSTPPRSEVDNVICLAEYVSQHLGTYLQALLIKLLLETEIYDDQEAVDCVGEHLRLLRSGNCQGRVVHWQNYDLLQSVCSIRMSYRTLASISLLRSKSSADVRELNACAGWQHVRRLTLCNGLWLAPTTAHGTTAVASFHPACEINGPS